jgi:hypothetical protein
VAAGELKIRAVTKISFLDRKRASTMGDYYQIIADLDADLASAETTAARLRDWLVSREIIVLAPSPYHASGPSYVAAKNFNLVSGEPYPQLHELLGNWVEFVAKHEVFYSAGLAEPKLVCSSCGKTSATNDAWSDAIGEWFDGSGSGVLACPQCAARAPIADWQHNPPWAFGNVGVKFWNWPSLREDFVRQVSDILGHRCRLVYGKL